MRLGVKTMKQLLRSLALLPVLAFGLSHAWAQETTEIGLVVMATNSEYWLAVKAGADAAAEEAGNVEVTFVGPADNADVQGQVALVENLVNRQVDAILLTPLSADALVPPVQAAEAAGIPVIVIDSGLNWDGVTSFIATDNVAASKLAMNTLIELIGGEGKVAIINALAGIPSNDARNTGAQEAIAENPDVELLPIQRSIDQVAALQNTENLITANPDIKGIFGAFNRGALGAAQAVLNRGIDDQVSFVAFDADPDEIRLLEQGTIDALVVQQPYQMGYLGVEYALKAINGEEVPALVHPEVSVVTRENMNDPEIQAVLYPGQQ